MRRRTPANGHRIVAPYRPAPTGGLGFRSPEAARTAPRGTIQKVVFDFQRSGMRLSVQVENVQGTQHAIKSEPVGGNQKRATYSVVPPACLSMNSYRRRSELRAKCLKSRATGMLEWGSYPQRAIN